MHPIPPRLRPDLAHSRQATPEGVIYIIKEPFSETFYRLREVEGFIAEQLDGATAAEEICKRVQDKFDATLTTEALGAFVKTLDRNGLLETAHAARKAKPQGWIVGGLLYARIRLFNPKHLFEFLIRHTGFFFTRRFMQVSAVVIVAATLVSLFNWREISQDAARVYSLSTLPWLIATIFVTGSAHEMSHGLTCKHFGGEVRDMGFMLIYFQPALYCNVSDAWLFPEKSKRLWVGFAGPYFELFMGAVATLLWRVTEPDSWINRFSLLVMGASGIKTLLNLNPLIKYDGYYLLADYLEVPNLRRRSFAWVGSILKRVSGVIPRLPAVSARERRIFTWYGFVALGISVVFFTGGALTIVKYLIQHDQRAALFGFLGMAGFRYRQYLSRMFGKRTSSGSAGSSSGRGTGGGRAAFKLTRPRALKLAAAVAALLLLFVGHMELTVPGAIDVLPYHNNDVRAQIAGLVAAVYVQEGESVKQGDPVARLDDTDLRNQLAQTQASIAQQKANLAQLVAGPTPDEIKVARQAVDTAQDQLKFTQMSLGRNEALYQRGLIASSAYDAARQAEATAADALADAEGKLRVLLDGTRPETIAAARAQLAGLQAQQSYLQTELSEMNVVSPSAGVVTTPTRELDGLIHQSVPQGGLIAKVYDVKVITVEVEVPESEIADVEVGQPVEIKARAYPDRVFTGKVVEIGTTTDASPAVSLTPSGPPAASSPAPNAKTPSNIRVITEIDNHEGLLKPGMTGMAKIDCGRRRVVDLVTRRLSRTVRVDLWSWL